MGGERSDRARESKEPLFGECGIDIDRFEEIVEQNNYGATEYSEE